MNINEQDIKTIIKEIQREQNANPADMRLKKDTINKLLSFLKFYIEVAGRMPKELIFTPDESDSYEANVNYQEYVRGFNQSLQACILAFMKEKESQIRQINELETKIGDLEYELGLGG